MYFKSKKYVAYYDCDVNNQLKLSSAIRLMQQTSSEHLASINVPVEKLLEENMAFLLTQTMVKIHKMPRAANPINIGTAAVRIRGPRFYREFTIEDEQGNHYIDAMTLWILVEVSSRRILRPKEYPYDLPIQESITEGALQNITVPKVEERTPDHRAAVEVGYSLLDVNQHVNNSYYADIVCDALPYETLVNDGLDFFMINYNSEALLGDTVKIQRYDVAPKSYQLIGEHNRGTCFESYVLMK